jgi:signal transduction histidine kinase
VKRLVLFGIMVIVPCGLLIVCGGIMIRQERELTLRHAEDRRQAEAYRARQLWLAELEKRKRDAAADFFAGRKPAAAFAAIVTGSSFRTPWEAAVGGLPDVEKCERAEFGGGRPGEAVACYQQELAAQTAPRARSYLMLLLGRVLARDGVEAQTMAVERELLGTPLSLADDQGVPFAYYAADRLLRGSGERDRVRARFAQEERLEGSPQTEYLLNQIAERLDDAAFRQKAGNAVALAKHVEALRGTLPGMLDALRRDAAEPVWLDDGDWKVALAKTPESGKELLVTIASGDVPAPAPPAANEKGSPLIGVYAASLGLVLLLTASGAYMLWRDVRREVEMAKLRSQFVSSVSHELKTPLTAIRMFAETLQRRPDVAARTDYLETIVHESERLSRLVDNVLDFSKMERGQRHYQLRPTSVTAVVEAVAKTAQYPLRQAGFALKVSAEETDPVEGDNDALQQAVLNLVMNAIKYSGGRKEIEIEARQEKSEAVIAVRDYGIGIPVEHRQKIFERFYRVPSAENQRIPGAGLGLTLVADITKAHGGMVTVESEPGVGSLFALRLPVMRSA